MVVNRIVFFWLRWQPRFAVGPIYIWKYSCAEWYTVLNHDKLLIYNFLMILVAVRINVENTTLSRWHRSEFFNIINWTTGTPTGQFLKQTMDMYEVSGLVFSLFFWFNHFISKGTFHHFSFKFAPGKTCDIWTVSCYQLKLPPFHHISVVYIIVRFSNAFLMMTKTEHVIIFSYPGQFRNTISRHSMPNDSTKKLWNVFRPSTVQFREIFPQQIFSPE